MNEEPKYHWTQLELSQGQYDWQTAANNIKVCPRCTKTYGGYPAISRMDNETPICSDCGRAEAIIAMKTGKRKLIRD